MAGYGGWAGLIGRLQGRYQAIGQRGVDVQPDNLQAVSWREAMRTWARIAALSFGGPAGQIAVMHRILVEEKRWISDARFLHALNYCMLVPGPEAQQLAVYIGWLMHRVRGGVLAGTLFILPGLVTLGLLSWLYIAYGEIGFVSALFFGLKSAVLAIVLDAVVRIGRRALKSRALAVIAGLTFVAPFLFAVPFPLVILAAGVLGVAGQAWIPGWFRPMARYDAGTGGGEGLIDRVFAQGVPAHVRPDAARFAVIALFGGLLWQGPLALLMLTMGPGNVFAAIAAFNSKMAVVTLAGLMPCWLTWRSRRWRIFTG